MKVSIVVPIYNEEEISIPCLNGLSWFADPMRILRLSALMTVQQTKALIVFLKLKKTFQKLQL